MGIVSSDRRVIVATRGVTAGTISVRTGAVALSRAVIVCRTMATRAVAMSRAVIVCRTMAMRAVAMGRAVLLRPMLGAVIMR